MTNRQELIEKLKTNEKPFGLLSEEEQELITSIWDEEVVEVFSETEGWTITHANFEKSSLTYRIKSDYTEEKQGRFEVYDVKCGDYGHYYFQMGHKYYLSQMPIKGYAGVQFQGQTSCAWYMHTSRFISKDGQLLKVHFPDENFKPAVPVKIRFWVEG